MARRLSNLPSLQQQQAQEQQVNNRAPLPDPLLELSLMRKTPAVAKIIGAVVGILLGSNQHPGQIPNHAPWLQRIGNDPEGTLQEIESCSPDTLSNASLHTLLTFIHRTPDMSESALLELEQSTTIGRWAAPLARIGLAALRTAARCQNAEGRMPMDPATILCCVDGSRLSYLALEVAATLLKHGRLVVLHVAEEDVDEEMPDLGIEFIKADLEQRCSEQLRIPAHRLTIIISDIGSGGSQSSHISLDGNDFKQTLRRVMRLQNIDTVVLGCYGSAGARIGNLGSKSLWGVRTVDCCTILANPYSTPVPPPTAGRADSMRPALFMVAVKAERPLNKRLIYGVMRLMSHWHSLLIYVLLNEAQTKAEAMGVVAQPPIAPVVADLKEIIASARLIPGDGDLTRRSSVKVEKYNNTKTKEQMVVRMADAERADFLCLDRKDDIHDGVIKSCRASVILIEK
jgi:nucleotide-binding universal stress UspA family protein